jgi:hypothetical protein
LSVLSADDIVVLASIATENLSKIFKINTTDHTAENNAISWNGVHPSAAAVANTDSLPATYMINTSGGSSALYTGPT